MDLEHPLFVNLPRAMEAFSDYPGNSLDRQVFADISQFANRYGRAFTTTRAIAARIGRRREEVSKSVNRLKDKGFLTITQEKKGLDRHPRNVYHIAKRFLRRHPDKRSKHFNASRWRHWCEIGKKRAITIALKKKQEAQAAVGTIRDTAARMAAAAHPASASPSQPVPLTPSQASQARQKRSGGFASFGSVLSGLFGATPAAAATPAVTDTYVAELQRRGDIAQTLRQNEARQAQQQAATVMAIQLPQQTAAPIVAALTVQPMTQDTTAASQQAAQEVARASLRASRPLEMASPWPSSTAAGQPIQSQPEPVSTASKPYETDLSDEPLPDYYLQQQAATATVEHTWRDNVPGYRHETATVPAGPTTTAPAETVAASYKSETSYVPGEWRHNVPAAYRKDAATVDAMKPITETPEQASAKARGDTVRMARQHEPQSFAAAVPGATR